jgi:hypothetical protein
MFEQAFKNIDDVLRKEAGCTTELDYTEQSFWLLFLKYLDGLEQDKAMESELEARKHAFFLDKPCQWGTWAAPKGKDEKLDHNSAMTGDDLRDFVNQKLFPYLHGFKQKASGENTIIWVMLDAMAANITLHGRLFARWLKWFNPKLVNGSTMELAALPAFYVSLSTSLRQIST